MSYSPSIDCSSSDMISMTMGSCADVCIIMYTRTYTWYHRILSQYPFIVTLLIASVFCVSDTIFTSLSTEYRLSAAGTVGSVPRHSTASATREVTYNSLINAYAKVADASNACKKLQDCHHLGVSLSRRCEFCEVTLDTCSQQLALLFLASTWWPSVKCHDSIA